MNSGGQQFALTRDGALQLRVETGLLPRVDRWLPHTALACDVGAADILIEITSCGSACTVSPAAAPTLRLGDTACTIDGHVAVLQGPGVAGRIDLTGAHATLAVAGDGTADVMSALNLAVALLLARRRRYLLHCAAVRSRAGGAWLLAGDARSGKTTTSLNLARAGWTLLSDDHVVLRPSGGRWVVEGWPRLAHPDAGWLRGVVTGARTELDARTVPGVHTCAEAPLEGILLPRVVHGTSTTLRAATHADALAMVLRQGAWCLADDAVAGTVFADLAALTGAPSFSLELAPDTFADPQRLDDIVGAATRAAAARTYEPTLARGRAPQAVGAS